MSLPPNQPDPKEAVEAQLCAYLEGDLSPAEQTSIERHLAGHPQHRQLLADLGRAREWTRELPRETAPPEVAEVFQQQVERSLLMGQRGGSSRHAGRWPQRAMLAAVAVVTVGLGVLLVLMLANPGRRVGPVAVGSEATRPAIPSAPAERPRATRGRIAVVVPAPPPKAVPVPSLSAEVADAARSMPSPMVPGEADKSAGGQSAGGQTVHLRVRTSDVGGVDPQLVDDPVELVADRLLVVLHALGLVEEPDDGDLVLGEVAEDLAGDLVERLADVAGGEADVAADHPAAAEVAVEPDGGRGQGRGHGDGRHRRQAGPLVDRPAGPATAGVAEGAAPAGGEARRPSRPSSRRASPTAWSLRTSVGVGVELGQLVGGAGVAHQGRVEVGEPA